MFKIVAIGDSITWGFPYGEDVSWVNSLNKHFNHKNIYFINKGINGDTFPGIYARLKRDVYSNDPDYCLVSSGINDCFSDYSLPEMKTNLLMIVNALKENQVRPIIGLPVNIPPAFMGLDRKVMSLQDELISLSQKEQIPYLDFRCLSSDDFMDDVHPSLQGYEKMSKRAIAFFESFLNT